MIILTGMVTWAVFGVPVINMALAIDVGRMDFILQMCMISLQQNCRSFLVKFFCFYKWQ